MKKINKGKNNKIQNTQKNPQKRVGFGLSKVKAVPIKDTATKAKKRGLDEGHFSVVGIGASASGLEA